jgi:UDP-glucuronate 4-epimerase
MNILVTGSAGFIGSKVCELLLQDGHHVIGVDNLNDAYDVRLKDWRLAQLQGKPGFDFHRLDICDRAALKDLFHSLFAIRHSPLDAVINLAARAGVRPSVDNPWVYYETNIGGCLNLLDLCREFGVNKFVLASTSSLYGQPKQLDNLNKLNKPFRESDPTDQPLSPYAASKKAAEALCYTYYYLHNIDVSVLRFFTVYGPGGRPDMSLFRFVQWINEGREVTVFGDGKQSRDFTYVEDIARGTVASLKPLGFEIINLGSDKPVVLNEAIGLIEGLVKKSVKIQYKPRHPADVLATWADISKAKKLLKWKPTIFLEEGLSNLVSWYQDNRDWTMEIATE